MQVKSFQKPVFGDRDLPLEGLMNTSMSVSATWWLRLRDAGDDGLGFPELRLQGKRPSVRFLCLFVTPAWKLESVAYSSTRLASLQTDISVSWRACPLAIDVLNGDPGKPLGSPSAFEINKGILPMGLFSALYFIKTQNI